STKAAGITAEVLVTTDTWGIHTHGTKQLYLLLKNFRDRRMNPEAIPELTSEGPGWALYDGHNAMPMVSSFEAMKTAIAKAKETGIAYVGVKNSGHFGGAGYYANMAARRDMIGVSMCNVDPGVAVPGSRTAVLGTNPLAYAVPVGKDDPVFLDIATSVVAASKIFAAQALKKSIPDNWLLDKNGLPTNNPDGYPGEGALMPMAGHKGYGIALLIEVLAGILPGAAFTKRVTSWVMDSPDPVNQGHAFMAINVDSIMPIAKFKRLMHELVMEIRETPKAEGAERIYLPGEKEWENRARALIEGIQLPEDAVANLKLLADEYELNIKKLFSPDSCN
ncbi:MAG: Ldh family oxidoreductase, partial [Victivallales bacterium]|nr:Ldh family oxidoreductase [Victivallales bacterium]